MFYFWPGWIDWWILSIFGLGELIDGFCVVLHPLYIFSVNEYVTVVVWKAAKVRPVLGDYQGRIQESAGSRRAKKFGVWGFFLFPFTYTLSFRSEISEKNTYFKHCILTTIKLYVCYAVKRRARAVRRSWIRLWLPVLPLSRDLYCAISAVTRDLGFWV